MPRPAADPSIRWIGQKQGNPYGGLTRLLPKWQAAAIKKAAAIGFPDSGRAEFPPKKENLFPQTCRGKGSREAGMVSIELLVPARNELGEGPLWDVAEQRLYWIDSLGKSIWRCDAGGGEVRQWPVPEHIGSMALRKSGGAVLALRNGFHFFDFDRGRTTPIADPESDRPNTRFNDGKVDRRGRFVAGTMDYEEKRDNCGLHSLGVDGRTRQIDQGIICSNGPCWSPDGKTFYFADTWKKTIYAYDYDLDTGAATNKRPWVVTKEPGAPDGSTVDAEGYLWNAQVYGNRIVRYAPDGHIDREIEFPVRSLTSVMFGGPDLDILYVTSMARSINGVPPKEAEAGHLFAVKGLGVRGLPEPRFAG
jgi:L-arabinonolactonase